LPQRFGLMSLRKNFDSFTSQHKLRDAEEQYVQAVYRLRAADEAYAQNLVSLKREMEFLLRKVGHYRYCVYSGEPIEEYVEWPAQSDRCPKPAWV